MIKILQILEATVGGTRRHLVSLVRGINKDDFHVEVAAPHVRQTTIGDTSFTKEIEDIGIQIHTIDMKRSINPWADLKALWALTRLIRQEGYDVIHVHSSKAGLLGRIAAKLNGKPVVYTPNGFFFLSSAHPLKNWFYLSLERLAGRFTDCLIAVSAGEKAEAIERVKIPADKVKLIPNAIEAEQFQPDQAVRQRLRVELGIEDEALVVGTVARFIEQKDPATFVYAANEIAKSLPNARFVWCGEGPLQQEIEQLVKELKLTDFFYFLGYRQDAIAIMQTFDVFVLTSIFEGLPYTILEAMALGLPLVVTDVVGNRDIVSNGQNGAIVASRQPEHVAKATLNILNDKGKRLAMGKKGRDLVVKRYDLNMMIVNTEAVYRFLA